MSTEMHSKQLPPSVHAAAEAEWAISTCNSTAIPMQWEHTENKSTDLACHWHAVCEKIATGGQTRLLAKEGRLLCMPACAPATTGVFLPAVSIPVGYFVAFAEA